MNLTELTSDAKYVLATKLSGSELVKLCATNSEMRKLCTLQKYNSIWINKLKEDFNVDYMGKDAYMEYLQHSYLYKNDYWVVVYTNLYSGNEDETQIFKSRSEALTQIYSFIKLNDLTNKMTYAAMKSCIEAHNTVVSNYTRISLLSSSIERCNETYEIEYQKSIINFCSSINNPELKDDIERVLNEIFNDSSVDDPSDITENTIKNIMKSEITIDLSKEETVKVFCFIMSMLLQCN